MADAGASKRGGMAQHPHILLNRRPTPQDLLELSSR
jgi:hypothetical protein